MGVRIACPACGSERFKRNGHIHTGQQNHQCKACGRQLVLEADNRVIGEEQRPLVERLLCEKISLHGICRAVGVSLQWLMGFMVARFAALPNHLHGLPVAAPREVLIGRLEGEADEMWSFVAKKAHKQLSLSRLNHRLPGCETHPEVVQGTAEFHHQIMDAFFPQADTVFHDTTALHATVDMLDPQPTLV